MIISLDTETTGLDLHHGARPYLVTIGYEEEGEVYTDWWEWNVCPYTRKVKVKRKDLLEIQRRVDAASEIIFQNPKFDLTGLFLLYQDHGLTFRWNWSKVRDTLLAGHLLRSNQRHDLTTMTLVYLGINVQPFEDAIKRCTTKCRNLAQGVRPQYDWRIAKKHCEKTPRPEMPSAKEKVWKSDMWLPRYVARLEEYDPEHEYWTVCSDYANSDSDSTYRLWIKMQALLQKKELWAIYQERLKILPVVYEMESIGVTVNADRFAELREEYQEASTTAAENCMEVASAYGYDLTLPKSGNNKSLTTFCFGEDTLALDPYERSKKTNAPSLNARCIEHYGVVLPEDSPQRKFVVNLSAKRKRDTALGYVESYERYWIPLGGPPWYRLHPSLNVTGTDTLRWSSSNPNEQNISKKEGFNLRHGFGPAPGREWWSGDAKNIELRIPAYESGQQELIDLFETPDVPPYYGSTHLLNFHTVYEDLWDKQLRKVGFEKVGPHCKNLYASTWYKYCKNGGFAVQYGAVEIEGKEGTADKAFHRLGSHAKLKKRFDKLGVLNQQWIDYANKYGYVETLPDKTVDPNRGYPVYCSRTNRGYVKPTIPLNYHVQSTAMQWMTKAMVRVQEYLDELNTRSDAGYWMVIQVHDEIVLDFPRGKGKQPWKTNLPKIRKIRRLMEEGGDDIGIPTPVGFEYHAKTWSEGLAV